MNYKMQRGFIALISTILLSGMLLLVGEAAARSAYFAHEAMADEYAYRSAQQAAFSCARFAVSRLQADPERFAGSGTTTIQTTASSSCAIISASSTASAASALVEGDSALSSVRFYLTADRATSSAFVLRTWTEY